MDVNMYTLTATTYKEHAHKHNKTLLKLSELRA